MKLAEAVKPISYVKAHAAELLEEMARTSQPVVITQNGEAKAVLQSVHDYEATQQTLALLKILALSRKDLDEGRAQPAPAAFASLRKSIRSRRQL